MIPSHYSAITEPQSNYKLSSSSQEIKASVDPIKQLGSNSGNGPGRPMGSKGMSSKMHVNTMHSLDQRKDVRELHKSKILLRPPLASSKAQVSKPPLKQIPKSPDLHDQGPKSKPLKHRLEEPEDDVDVSRMIKSMFNYNPDIFVDDDGIDNMEADFDEIVREEKRSSLIFKKEDEEQLRLIEDEERV
ncbi:hypothetical protein RYX36_009065 [Vicia faba]